MERKIPRANGIYVIDVIVTRRSGDPKLWEGGTYTFLDDLHEQLLTWRSLSESERLEYKRVLPSQGQARLQLIGSGVLDFFLVL